MNSVQQLMLLMLVLSSALVILGNEVNISIYYISDPDVFTGRIFQEECGISSVGLNRTVTGCPIVNSPRLIDGVTGEGSSSLNTNQFVGWNSQSHDTFIVSPGFDQDATPGQVDIYFHNNPAMGIGLPPIAVIYVGYNTLHGYTGPISFTYANNQQLIESNDDTAMISVVITTNYVAEAISLEFTSFWLEFDFSSTTLSQALISEIKLFAAPVNVTDQDITFLFVSDDIELGRDNLVSSVEVRCTVAIDGQFSWSWTGPNGAALNVSRTSVSMADLTCTSILRITYLSLSDAGQYTCTASLSDGPTNYLQTSRSSNISINAGGIVSTRDSLTAIIGQSVSLTCDFSGYLPGAYNITWTGPQGAALTSSGRHSISIADGLGQSQSGGDSPGPSVLSILTISNVEETDAGNYDCMMVVGNNSVLLTGSTELSTSIELSTNASATEPTDESTSQLALIAGVVVGGVLLVAIAIVVIILLIVCVLSKRSRRKVDLSNNGLYSEVGVKPAPPPIPSYFYPEGTTSEYAVITKDAMEMNEIDGSSALLSLKQGDTRESPQPVKLSNNSIAMPRASYQDNPMYASADCLDREGQSPSSVRTADSLPALLDQEDEFSPSSFNIYATANPPPIPPYHGPPEESLYDDEIGLALFKKSHTPGSGSSDDCLAPYSSIYSNPQPLKRSEALLEVTEKNIHELNELGMGQFGRVVLAHTVGLSLKELKLSESSTDRSINILVAVKRLKPNAEESTREAFEKEIKFMARLRHENVVRLVGVCLSKNAFIMMEYMENGDLNQFLRKHTLVEPYVDPLPDDTVNASVLVYMSLQIASGMRYLSSLKYIHRDLATRNILVGQEFTVKIADFGMSRDLYDSYYYRISGRAILPIRWMANECFYGRFTEKTDVWAFGVTIWEIFMLCKDQPYAGMTDQEVVDDAVKGADRMILEKPSSCPDEVYEIMQKCWIHVPEDRISFLQLHHLLEQVHARTKFA